MNTVRMDTNFLDINHDGITDVLWIEGRRAWLFINRGNDLKIVQLVVYGDGLNYRVAQLSKAQTGFLKSIDNGQGVVHQFDYQRLPAQTEVV